MAHLSESDRNTDRFDALSDGLDGYREADQADAEQQERCYYCGQPMPPDRRPSIYCSTAWEENFDGWPEVICDEADKRHHETLCEECYEKREAAEKDEAQS